jgi:hypothetical protein
MATRKELERLGRRLAKARACADRFTSTHENPDDVTEKWAPHAVIWDLMDNAIRTPGDFLHDVAKFQARYPVQRVENRSWWPFVGGYAMRHEVTITTPDGREVWSPGFTMSFLDGDQVVHYEEYMDSSRIGPLALEAFGDTRRAADSRPVPPARSKLSGELIAGLDRLEVLALGEQVAESVAAAARIRAVPRGDPSSVGTRWAKDARIWCLMDNAVRTAAEYMEHEDAWWRTYPDQQNVNLGIYPFVGGYITRSQFVVRTADGREVWSPGAQIVWLRDGAIGLYEEYQDSARNVPLTIAAFGDTRRSEHSRPQPPALA